MVQPAIVRGALYAYKPQTAHQRYCGCPLTAGVCRTVGGRSCFSHLLFPLSPTGHCAGRDRQGRYEAHRCAGPPAAAGAAQGRQPRALLRGSWRRGQPGRCELPGVRVFAKYWKTRVERLLSLATRAPAWSAAAHTYMPLTAAGVSKCDVICLPCPCPAESALASQTVGSTRHGSSADMDRVRGRQGWRPHAALRRATAWLRRCTATFVGWAAL